VEGEDGEQGGPEPDAQDGPAPKDPAAPGHAYHHVPEPFSDRLDGWLTGDGPKTLGGLSDVFGEKGFAVTVMFLMIPAAIPAPTGGITHVFEGIAAVLGLQMIIGADAIWFPGGWRDRVLPDTLINKVLPYITGKIRKLERFSRRRGAWLLEQRWFIRVLGLLVIGFAAAAFFSPPFSGLDTLPALGAVLFALGIVLNDLLFVAIGVVIGGAGAILTFTVGAAVLTFMSHALHWISDPVSRWWNSLFR
jgi:hypothetical protein